MVRTAFQGVHIGHVVSRKHTMYNSKNYAVDTLRHDRVAMDLVWYRHLDDVMLHMEFMYQVCALSTY